MHIVSIFLAIVFYVVAGLAINEFFRIKRDDDHGDGLPVSAGWPKSPSIASGVFGMATRRDGRSLEVRVFAKRFP